MYNYWGFGLKIASEIALPELMEAEFEKADVTISVGAVPLKLEGENIIKRNFSALSETEYTLEVATVCKYYAGFGKVIIIEPFAGADEHSIRLFMLGTVMAAIIYQRGKIPLHASAIVKDGKLTLFTGNSGAGKSTTLAYLSTKGYEVFTDDICVVEMDSDNKQVCGTASYPLIKLWEDSLQKIQHNSFDREFRVRPQLPKYGQFFHEVFRKATLPIEKVFILNIHNESTAIRHKKLDSLMAFKQLERQAYRYRFVMNGQLRSTHFGLITELCATVPVIETSRPSSGSGLAEFADMVESLL